MPLGALSTGKTLVCGCVNGPLTTRRALTAPVFWPYAVIYAIVIALTLDLMYILAVNKRQFIDLFHVLIVLL